MSKLVVFFYIDALNSSFINSQDMPFLYGMADNSYTRLENVVGYSFAIQSCMMGGHYPDENNQWMPYFLSSEKAPTFFKVFGKLSSTFMLDNLPKLRGLFFGQLRRFFLQKGAPTNNIPSLLIDKMCLYPYYYMCELPSFHKLQKTMDKYHNTKFTYIGPPALKNQIYSPLMDYVSAIGQRTECILAYDDKLDILGHKYGPRSKEYSDYVSFVDYALSITHKQFRKRFNDDFTFIVFSDHGQCDQTFEFDILSALSKVGLYFGKDYLSFVDATMALFWPKDKTIENRLIVALSELGVGRVLDDDYRKRHHLRFMTDEYGELFFVLNPGGTFFPNFFSPFGTLKGLHGYLPEDDVQKAFLIANKNLSQAINHVKDVKNLLLESVNSKT